MRQGHKGFECEIDGVNVPHNPLKEVKADMKTLKDCVKELEDELRCNCDLDNWEPERDTGHSWVCRIHKAAKARFMNLPNDKIGGGTLPAKSDC